MSARALTACVLLACGCFFAMPARSQYDVEEPERAWVRFLLDLRIARGPAAPSWTDGGPGKTRFGGRATDSGFRRATRFETGQLAIQAGAALPWELRADLQLNVQRDIAGDYSPWIVEALLRREWDGDGSGFGVQAGVMTPPFALERTGPAWTPERTLTPSALESWIWEEHGLAGVEAEWWKDTPGGLRLGLLAGAGFGPDFFGKLLALRGWAMGDHLGGVGGDLPLPDGSRMEPFDEQDDRPALYTLLTLGDAGERATLKLGAFDNRGDEGEPGVWHTRLVTAGAIFHPHPSVDVVAQYLDGRARVRDTTNDSDLRAWYGLVSWRHRDQLFTLRYDDFRVEDVDGGNPTGEEGDALTAAWLFHWGLRHRIGVEHVWLDSRRPEDAAHPLSSDGWQLSYRFRY
jgi:hypothetical protein